MSRIEAAMKRAQAARLPVSDQAVISVTRPVFEPEPEPAPAPTPPAVAVNDVLRTPLIAPPAAAHGRLVTTDGVDVVAVEEYRRLAGTLHRLQLASDLHVVMVTSAAAGEGKTLSAANLALTLSESYHRRVLLIDADLRRPGIGNLFGLSGGAGLSEALRGLGGNTLPVVQVTTWLSVLQAGTPDGDPMSGLTSTAMSHIMEDAAAAYDWVVVDTPPVGLLPDASLLASQVDGIVLVVAAGKTPLAGVERAVESIGQDKILGVVLNRVERSRVGSRYGHSYGRYGSKTPDLTISTGRS